MKRHKITKQIRKVYRLSDLECFLFPWQIADKWLASLRNVSKHDGFVEPWAIMSVLDNVNLTQEFFNLAPYFFRDMGHHVKLDHPEEASKLVKALLQLPVFQELPKREPR